MTTTEISPPRTKRRRVNHPPFNWEAHARVLLAKLADRDQEIQELRRQVAALTLKVTQPGPISLDAEGQPIIHIPDYLTATLIREYNTGRETFPTSPRYQAFDGYVIDRVKDTVYGLNGLGVHEQEEGS